MIAHLHRAGREASDEDKFPWHLNLVCKQLSKQQCNGLSLTYIFDTNRNIPTAKGGWVMMDSFNYFFLSTKFSWPKIEKAKAHSCPPKHSKTQFWYVTESAIQFPEKFTVFAFPSTYANLCILCPMKTSQATIISNLHIGGPFINNIEKIIAPFTT